MTLSPEELERYARHIVLKQIGGPGQQKLKSARVLIVGAGGLGGPAALYLAAAGVGEILLADDDAVSLSNLQRQILFASKETGQPKAQAGAARLRALNPHVRITPLEKRLDADSARQAMAGAAAVLDGSDNFETRFAVNAASRAAGVPLISGAAIGFSGQLGLFNQDAAAPCYRCLVPQAPPDAATCEAVGVAGPVCGVIGAAMAMEAIKLITGAGRTLSGRLMIHDALEGASRTVALRRDPACPECGRGLE